VRSEWANYWNHGTTPYAYETVSAIIYDHTKNQTNSLLKHFNISYPNEYVLRPSQVAMDRFADPAFNPLGTLSADPRASSTFRKSGNDWYLYKYRRDEAAAYQDDVPIYIYRAGELYFMLAEALNNLGRFDDMEPLINMGIPNTWTDTSVPDYYRMWICDNTGVVRKYGDLGVRGVHQLAKRTFVRGDIKANDLAILDEMMLEFAGEGKIYPAMIRMAKRYNDYSIITDRVSPKYADPTVISDRIMAGGYFVPWKLK
jgi:hypothetical protein